MTDSAQGRSARRAGRPASAGFLDPIWMTLGEQLRRPTGAKGAIVGKLMAILNTQPYSLTIDRLELQPDDHVLDLGFGPGRSLAALVARTPRGRVCGIDHSVLMLQHAIAKYHAAIAIGRMELRHGTFGALPWTDGAFDKILVVNAVYFFDATGRDMSEAFRVLRPGGRLAVYATDRATMQRWPFSGPATHATFDAPDLEALLVGAGFDRNRVRVEAITLPLGIGGLIAVAEKSGSASG